MAPAERVVTGRVPADAAWACGIISRASLASGQAVRRLTLDQEIEGSNPSSPASSSPHHKMLWSAPTRGLHIVLEHRPAVRRRRRRTWFGHLTPLIFGHLIRRPRINGNL